MPKKAMIPAFVDKMRTSNPRRPETQMQPNMDTSSPSNLHGYTPEINRRTGTISRSGRKNMNNLKKSAPNFKPRDTKVSFQQDENGVMMMNHMNK